MNISFHGAARTVTGSKHLLQIHPNIQILLDCGLFQGMGKDTFNLNSNWGFNPSELSCVIISHAHIDHTGLLPKLVKDGFSGKIYCTPQTLELVKVLLLDSAYIQESDLAHVNKIRTKQGRPQETLLYSVEDAKKVFPYLIPITVNAPYKINTAVELQFSEGGHILGAAAVNLKIIEHNKIHTLTFSGDIGRYHNLILRSPAIFPQADYLIMESTYGNKIHDTIRSPSDKLLEFIKDTCLRRRGKLIIPAFSVGRTQEILYLLNQLETEHRLPHLPYYVDSPLSIETTEIIKKHPECFNKKVQELLLTDKDIFSFEGLKYLRTAQESIALNHQHEPCVIISASGMAEAGRVKHHIANNISNYRNTILITGYCEPHSLGGKLKNGAKQVSIYGTRYEVNAEIVAIESLSAHADYEDLCQWLSCQDANLISTVFLVHGEYETQIEFRDRLFKKGFRNIEIPNLHEYFNLNN